MKTWQNQCFVTADFYKYSHIFKKIDFIPMSVALPTFLTMELPATINFSANQMLLLRYEFYWFTFL